MSTPMPEDFDERDGARVVPIDAARRRRLGPAPEVQHAPPLIHDTATTTRTRTPWRARVRTLVRHPVTRATLRHAGHVASGARLTAERRRDARSTARHERMMRAAEVAGDHASALEWETRAASFRRERHARRMALLRAPVYATRALMHAGIATAGGLLALGVLLAIAGHRPAEVIVPFQVAIRIVWWIAYVIDVSWRPTLAAAPFVALAALWAVGRAHSPAPLRLAAGDGGTGRDVVPDESAILAALRNLGLSPMNKAIKDGWQPRWVTGSVRSGNGWHAQLLLPQGVTVEMVNARKTTLASNLMRKPIEVWPTEPETRPGVLDLWVADSGALTGAVPPWPLLTSGTCDYFKSVPVAVSLRGEQMSAPLMAKNYMIGGIMGTGKSSATRNILLGAMLDPLVEIDVYVMAFNADYDAMRPRLRTLVKGDDDEQVEAAVNALRKLRHEVTMRGQILEDAGEMALTRELAKRDARMRPLVVVFDECHELFMHKQHGDEAAELAVKVMKKARKCGITLIWTTVSPTADSIPRDVTRNTSNRVAFAVGDHIANDGLLGTGKHKAGVTATTLNPATDIGTSLTVGFSANPFDLLRWHYVRKTAAIDEITPVVQRAVKAREGITRADLAAPAEQAPDLLADILTVIGNATRERTTIVLQRLAALRPNRYEGWSGETLAAALATAGITAHKSNGYPVVTAAKVRAALAERDASEGTA